MMVVRLQATGTARVVDWRQMKKNVLVNARGLARIFRITTTVPDALQDVIDCLAEFDSRLQFRVIAPNSWTTASLDILLSGERIHVVVARRLVRGLFPINPIAPEFGSNYDLVVSIDSETRPDAIDALKRVFGKYPHQYFSVP